MESDADVDPGERSRVNESPQPVRLGLALDHETHQAHSGADHPQAQDRQQLIARGKAVADVCRFIEVTQPTYHRRRQ